MEAQINLLHSKQKLSELDIRLRYLLAFQLQDLVCKLFPQASVDIFGSAVTGLGRWGKDGIMIKRMCCDECSLCCLHSHKNMPIYHSYSAISYFF